MPNESQLIMDEDVVDDNKMERADRKDPKFLAINVLADKY
jgi:hypothetical protein